MTEEKQENEVARPRNRFLKEVESFIWAIVIVVLLRTFVIQAYKIPSGSMIPTLIVGDHLLAAKFTYGLKIPYMDVKCCAWRKPKRGEVVIFEFPLDPSKDFVKRVVGVGGDTVEVKDGVIYINGKKVPIWPVGRYSYKDVNTGEMVHGTLLKENLFGHVHYVLWTDGFEEMRNYGPYKVPRGTIFVMGDNRDHSNDSRFWGPVPLVKVKGTPLIIYFPWDSANKRIIWSRFFHIIR